MSNPERWIRHRPLPQDINNRLQDLAPLFKKEDVLLAYLFGSLAGKDKKSPRPPGGVYLAVLAGEKPAYIMREDIADVLGTDRLDLMDLRRDSPLLRFEILRSERPVYVSDEDLKARYELEILNLYRDTEPMRRRQKEYLKERMAEWCSGEK